MGISTEKAILHILLKEGETKTQRIIKTLSNFRKSERSVRSALSRLKNRGYVESKRSGKRTSYKLTSVGETTVALIREDKLRKKLEWDGYWHIVTFDIPELLRHVRDILRTRLLTLGYGKLHTSVWISPYNVEKEVKEILREYGIEEYVELFSSRYTGNKNLKKFAYKVWNLKKLQEQYNVFISTYKPELKSIKSRIKKKETIDSGFAFLKGVELEDAFYRIVLYDPDLPRRMLPKNWIGLKAKKLYEEYQKILKEIAPI